MMSRIIERKCLWVVLVCGLVAGCADPYRKDSQPAPEQETGQRPGVTEPVAQSSKTVEEQDTGKNGAPSPDNEQARRRAIERVYGKIQLNDYSGITIEWIEQHLKPEQVAAAVGTQSPMELQRRQEDELSYEWSDGDARGRVRIAVPLRDQSESQMMTQAAVTREMAKTGKAELVDLGAPGVVAVLRGSEQSELYLFTRDRAIMIDVGMVGGGDFNHSQQMKTAARAIAKSLIDLYLSGQSDAE